MTRLANVEGRATVIVDEVLVDVDRRSDGRFPFDLMAVLAQWDAFRDWASDLGAEDGERSFADVTLGLCVPRPTQVFAIGLNYMSHAEETGAPPPKYPMVFTKFQNCLAGPNVELPLPTDYVDYEAELVVIMGRGGRNITEEDALNHVAGYTAGQDYSERRIHLSGNPAQFSIGKSFPAFGPIGPALVTLDEFIDPSDLLMTCDISGERRQQTRTSDLIFSVPRLISYISGICGLNSGDIIFTGTPGGVGMGHKPPKFLRKGDVVETTIDGIGTMKNVCTGSI